MTSSPTLRPLGLAAKNDCKRPWHFNDTQGKQVPSSDPNRQPKDSLLNTYIGRGARLASFDSYNNSPEDADSLLEAAGFLPSDTRCPLIAEDDDDDKLNSPILLAHQDPAVLYIAPSVQLPSQPPHPLQPKPFHQNPIPGEEMDNPSNPSDKKNKYVNHEVQLSPSPSLEKPPLSPTHGYPYDGRVNTMSTECSSPQPPAYTARESNGSPDTMTPFIRLRSAVVGVHAAVRITRMQRLQKRAKWASKKFLVFTLSKVGLTCVVVAYVIGGAFLFQHLEGGGNSPNGSVKAPKTLASTSDPSPCASVYEYSEDDPIQEEVMKLREKYVNKMWKSTQKLNVLFFSEWQKHIRVDLEEFESKFLRLLKNASRKVAPSPAHSLSPKSDALVQMRKKEKWTYAAALLFCVAVITTIGYGDTVPVTDEGKVACIFYGLFGIPIMLLCLANIGHFLAICFRFLWQHARLLCLVKDKEVDRSSGFSDCKVRVPISVILLTLFIYLIVGASLFSGWEEWSFLNGCYFVFVTLSTIGFGDLVPGNTTKPANSHAQRVAVALYLLFGLSLVSMIFQLMQEWVRHIMARYAQFLGLTKEQIEKDKEVGETGLIEDEENMNGLLGDLCPGPGAAPGCSKVIVVGDCHKKSFKEHNDVDGLSDSEDFSAAEVENDAFQRANSNNSTGLDGLERQESLGDHIASKTSLNSDAKQPEVQAEPVSQQPPSVEEASNTLLRLFKKRQARDELGNQTPSSCSLNRESHGDGESNALTEV